MQNQISKNWQKVKLGDVAILNPSISMGTGKYPYIPMEDLDWNKKYVYEKEIKEFKGGAKFENGDVLFARITPCLENGKVGRAKSLTGDKGFGSTEYFVIRGKNGITDTDFLYYLCRTHHLRQTAINSMVGASGRQRANIDSLKKYEIDLPNFPQQQKIASILSAFDDKIEVNNKIAKTLEEIAQALFKERFSRSYGKEYSFSELAFYINGGAFGKIVNKSKLGLPLIKIADLNRGISENTEWIDKEVDERYYIKNGDLIFSWSGSIGLGIWDKGKAVLNQHLFNVLPKNEFSKGFLYFALKSKLRYFVQIAGSKATTMGHIKKDHLNEQKIIIPKNVDLSIFDSIYNKFVQLKLENQKLAALRDLLLPKLMKGEIRV